MRLLPALRRLVLPATLLVVAAVVLSACTTLEKAKSAAIVDGRSISMAQLSETTDDFNAHFVPQGQSVTEAQLLPWFIQGPFVLAEATRTNSWRPDDRYNAIIATSPQASQQTKDVVAAILAYDTLSDASRTAVSQKLAKADIQVDPRFGKFDPATGALTPQADNWFAPSTRPATPGGTPTQEPTPTGTATGQ